MRIYGATADQNMRVSFGTPFQAANRRSPRTARLGPLLVPVPMPFCSGDQLVLSKLDQNILLSPGTLFYAA